MNKLYVFLLATIITLPNTMFSMEESDSSEKKGLIATLRAVVRRGSFSKKKEEADATRARSNSASGYSLPMWRAKIKVVLINDKKKQLFTPEEAAQHLLKLKEYLLMGTVIQARSDQWTQTDTDYLIQLRALIPNENNIAQKEEDNLAFIEDKKDKPVLIEQPKVFVCPEKIDTWRQNIMDLTEVYMKHKYTDVHHNKNAGKCILDGIQIIEKIGKQLPEEQAEIQRMFKLICEYYLKQTENLQDMKIQKTRSSINIFYLSMKNKKFAKKEAPDK